MKSSVEVEWLEVGWLGFAPVLFYFSNLFQYIHKHTLCTERGGSETGSLSPVRRLLASQDSEILHKNRKKD